MTTRRLAFIAAAIVSSATSAPGFAEPAAPSPDEAAGQPLDTTFPPESILGEWCTQKEENRPPARVNFVLAKNGSYMGILSWSSEPRKDVHNKDPNLRDRSVVGIVLMWNLHYDDGEYVDGYVYNPEDGGTYRVKLELASPESLKVRGYLGISLLGQTKVWTRFHP
ncbi:MAG TPA: DUF2147 domain-containing protein [Polyangiaceae bacterium]|nr:DUF2147 domain-containing protein [Polyangiaceae bacterium]